MAHTDAFYESIGKNSIFRKNFLCPEGSARAAVILVHGICEHCDRYGYVIGQLNQNQIDVYAFDHPGHGRSSGKKGLMSYEQSFEIIDHIRQELTSDHPDLPVFLYGHSMGGAIVICDAYQNPAGLCGCVITSPGLGFQQSIPSFMLSILKKLALLFPSFTIRNAISSHLLSHDPEVNYAYAHDPLVHNKISLQLGVDLFSSADKIMHEKKPFPLPALLLQGAADGIVSSEASKQFASFSGNQVEYHEIPNGFHELHNEPERDLYLKIIADWITNKANEATRRC